MQYPTDFRAIFLPYCLVKVDGKGYTVLNRNYKPLGQYTEEWVDYGDYALPIRGLGPKTISKVSIYEKRGAERIYLYDDMSNPLSSEKNMREYLKKIGVLMKLVVGSERPLG